MASELEEHRQPGRDLGPRSARTRGQLPNRYHPVAGVTKRLGVKPKLLPALVVVGRKGRGRSRPPVHRALDISAQRHDLNVFGGVGLQGFGVAGVEPLDQPVRELHVLLRHRRLRPYETSRPTPTAISHSDQTT